MQPREAKCNIVDSESRIRGGGSGPLADGAKDAVQDGKSLLEMLLTDDQRG